MTPDRICVVFPRTSRKGPAVSSPLLAAANLAAGFATLLPNSEVRLLTPEGFLDAAEVRNELQSELRPGKRMRERLPRLTRVALGDIRKFREARRLSRRKMGDRFDLVIQFHHRFHDWGLKIATQSACPLVLRVEGIEVEEEGQWGVRRPGWAGLTRNLGELRIFSRADVIAAVSEPLKSRLETLGVQERKVHAVPNGVDLDLFRPTAPVGQEGLAELDGSDRFLIGWVGSFRPYHGLDQIEPLIECLGRSVPNALLVLLGNGPEEKRLQSIAAEYPHLVRLVPAVPQSRIPNWLSTFDVCLQLADPLAGDHYSPLKTLEYLACGRAIVAADTAATHMLRDGQNALLVSPGDTAGYCLRIQEIFENPSIRRSLEIQARKTAEAVGSWSEVARKILESVAQSTESADDT